MIGSGRIIGALEFCLVYRGFSPYANFITANFIMRFFKKFHKFAVVLMLFYFISAIFLAIFG